MRSAFIFPSSGKSATVSNPYIDDFTSCLSDSITFLNKFKPSKTGIVNLFSYLGKIDIIFFNWVEDLPDKRGGFLQTLLFVLSVFIIKMKKIKIFYTLHNKESHYSTNRLLKKWLRRVLLKNADFILCHSSEGLTILNQFGIRGKSMYIPHPFPASKITAGNPEKKYDILIWGAIRPYKGIDLYLKFLASKDLLARYKTLIIGKIYPAEYELGLASFKSDRIQIENKFVDDESLNEIIDQSRIILFTYNENSVLSSGALIYSLSRGANVIGPHIGAFKDVYREGIIEVFSDFSELIEKIDTRLHSPFSNSEKINRYIEENSWKNMGTKIVAWINEEGH